MAEQTPDMTQRFHDVRTVLQRAGWSDDAAQQALRDNVELIRAKQPLDAACDILDAAAAPSRAGVAESQPANAYDRIRQEAQQRQERDRARRAAFSR